MRTDLRRRIQSLERQCGEPETTAVDPRFFGACLTAEEWQRVLSEFDDDPHVAFASITSDKVPAMVLIIGDESGPAPVPRSFSNLVECDDPRAHFWTARMAAWAIVYRGDGFWADQEPQGIDEAISRLLAHDAASERLAALCEAMRASDAATETRPIVLNFIGVKRRSPIAMEIIGKDALL